MTASDLHHMPGHYIRRAQQISTALFTEEMAGQDLTSVQFLALANIADVAGLDATTLAERIAFDKVTIGGVLDRLERKGLVTRAASPQDKRKKILCATASGLELLSANMGRVERVQQRLLAPLTPAEQADFLRLIAKLTEAPDIPADN